MKYLHLILISLFLFSCSVEEDHVVNVGSENGSCFEDKTCNLGLMCNSDNICIKKVIETCEGVNCNGFGTCLMENDKARCICNDDYHSEELSCVKDSLECLDTEHEYNGECLSNTKMVDCTDVTPLNATKILEQVEVTYSNGYWSTPADCKWKCKEHFELVDNSCKLIEEDPCADINCQPHATCSNGDCICDSGYEADGDSCKLIQDENSKTFSLGGLTLYQNEKVDLNNSVLVMQTDGNLVLYEKNPTKALWATSTNCGNDCNYKFTFQADGDLVVYYPNNTRAWSAGTNNMGVDHLIIDSTKLGLYDNQNHLIWSSTCDNGDLVNADCNLYSPCDDLNCWTHSTCTLNNNTASCVCDNGYELDGNSCVEINRCDGVNCTPNASCKSDDGLCYCNNSYHISSDGISCISDDICSTLTCGAHSSCNAGMGVCRCDEGFHDDNGACVPNDNNACGGCSGHGECYIKEDNDPVCACEVGYNPSNRDGLDCVPTSTICKPGAIDYDVDGDGVNETWFEPNELECSMFELVNFVRAVHDKEGSPESHKPLLYSLLWSAHARNHSLKMEVQGGLFHEDYPGGQNCAYNYSGTAMSHMTQYMGGDPTEPICKSASEPHCSQLSHHCNIMRPRFSYIGIGTVGSGRSYSTQNFY